MGEKQRRYCKNKTKGSRRGRKWDEETRTGVLMEMIRSNNICAVARKWGVPESTIRTWVAEESRKPEGLYVQARREAARQVAAAAAGALLEQVGYLAKRVEANARNAEISQNLRGRLREDAAARDWEGVGRLLHTEEERAEADRCAALVLYGAAGSRDKALTDSQREEVERQLALYAPMDDRSAAALAQALADVAARAAAMGAGPSEQATDDAPPVLYMGEPGGAEQTEAEIDE